MDIGSHLGWIVSGWVRKRDNQEGRINVIGRRRRKRRDRRAKKVIA